MAEIHGCGTHHTHLSGQVVDLFYHSQHGIIASKQIILYGISGWWRVGPFATVHIILYVVLALPLFDLRPHKKSMLYYTCGPTSL